MRSAHFLAAAIVAALVVPVIPADGLAQFGGLTDKLKKKVEKKVERKIDRAMDQAIDCALGDAACVEKAKQEGRPVRIVDASGKPITDEHGKPVTNQEDAALRAQKPGEGVWRNYDFTPGREVWFASDFANEKVGRFPAGQLEFVKGNMQIVEYEGERVIEVSTPSVFRVKLPKSLPEDFTLEFYLKTGAPNIWTNVTFNPLETAVVRHEGNYLELRGTSGIYDKGKALSSISSLLSISTGLTPIKLQVDGNYAMLYVGTERAANLPNAAFRTSDMVEFHVHANNNLRSYIKDIVVAVGIDELYETLSTKGEYTTRGIFFDSGSDQLRPESTPVLEEIQSALESHADLALVIEGHTDSQGEDAYNLDLSNRRAAAVVAHLTAEGIAASRLASVGKGESAPVADNATPAGRQENRRVVLRVKK